MLSRIVRAIVFAATLWASAGLTWWTAPSFAQELPLTPRELPVDVEDGPDLVLPAPPPGFVTERRGQVEWVYPARAREEALGLMRAYDKEWPRIVEELGGDVDARLVVRIGKDPQEMERLAPLNAPPPAYASGVAYPASGWILLTLSAPETWELPNLRLVFAHELSHIALHRAVNGVPLPRWFVEGVAINQSGERSFERVRTLWEANVSGNLVTMRALSRSFPSRAHEVNIAYAQSASFVAFMHDDTDHADRVPSVDLGQRGQENVDRQRQAARILRRQVQASGRDVHQCGGRNQVYMIGLDGRVILDHSHRHSGMAGQEVAHHALVIRRQMLNHYEGGSRINRTGLEEFLQRIEAARRSADTDNVAVEIGILRRGLFDFRRLGLFHALARWSTRFVPVQGMDIPAVLGAKLNWRRSVV